MIRLGQQRLWRFAFTLAAIVAVSVSPPWIAPGNAQALPGGVTIVSLPAVGKQVYEEICQACHMADARGGGSAGAMVPALADNPRLVDKGFGITLLLTGRAGMPGFTGILTPTQLAAVLTYVRVRFNAFPDPVTVADIERVATGPLPRQPEDAPDDR